MFPYVVEQKLCGFALVHRLFLREIFLTSLGEFHCHSDEKNCSAFNSHFA